MQSPQAVHSSVIFIVIQVHLLLRMYFLTGSFAGVIYKTGNPVVNCNLEKVLCCSPKDDPGDEAFKKREEI
jgi:hypothetical protein